MSEYKVINYSEKAFAVLASANTALSDEFAILGGRYNPRLSCGAGWIFSKHKHGDALRGLLEDFGDTWHVVDAPAPADGVNPDNLNYILSPQEIRAIVGDKAKDYAVCIRLTSGDIVGISSDVLDTSVCFGHGLTATYEEAREQVDHERKTGAGFIAQNCSKLKRMIEALSDEHMTPYLYVPLHGRPFKLQIARENEDFRRHWRDPARVCELPDDKEDRQRLLRGYQYALSKQETRCKAYLKRYGTAKLRIRTYDENY